MADLTRFDHNIDIIEPAEGPIVSRFERLDREVELVDHKIMQGFTLEAIAENGRINVSLKPNGPSGKFPSLEIGLISLGEFLDGSPLEDVEGEAPGIEPVDQELLKGATLTVQGLGQRLIAVWRRSLPERTFDHKGKTHRVHRTGTRTATSVVAIRTLGVAREALTMEEKVSEGTILNS
jgi:hypothetical protein